MAMDVATLGLAVDSSGVVKGTSALNNLSAASEKAETATLGVTNAAELAQAALNGQATAATKAAAVSQASMNRMGGNMSGLAAQFQDIGVTAAMGMNPLQIALQQGMQIAGQMEMSMQAGASATGVFANALASLASPVMIASIALTAVAATLLQMVNWSQVGATALNALASVLETIAPYAIGAAAAIALLYAPAIMTGLWGLITTMGSLAASALSVAAAFAMANPALAFVAGIVAAVAAANIFRDELTKIFGVDIVGAAKVGANYVIGSFVAAYHDLEFLWKNFPAIIGSAAIGAANLAIQAMGAMIQKAADLVDSFANQANQWLPADYQIGTIGNLGFDKAAIANPYADQLSNAVSARNSQMQKDLNADYIGSGIKLIETSASAASAKLKDLAKSITSVDDAKKKAKEKTDPYGDIVDGAKRRIETLKAEQAALGMTEQASLQLKYETELLNQAKQKDITLTAAQKAELSGLAAEMASTEIATRNAREAMDFAKDATSGFLSTLRQGLVNGEGWWKSLGNAANSVLDKIASKLEEMFVNSLFESSSGGILGSLFGGLFGGSTGGSVGSNANGTNGWRGGLTMVGERGPELISLPTGSKVIPNHRMGQGGQSSMDIRLVWDADDGINAKIENAKGDIVKVTTAIQRAGLETYRRNNMASDVKRINKDPRRTG